MLCMTTIQQGAALLNATAEDQLYELQPPLWTTQCCIHMWVSNHGNLPIRIGNNVHLPSALLNDHKFGRKEKVACASDASCAPGGLV